MQTNWTNRNVRCKASTADPESHNIVQMGDDYSSRLPAEMLASIFELLSQPDVLRVARVCHRWRAVARLVPTFYAHVGLEVNWLYDIQEYRSELEEYTRELGDAAGTGFRLSMMISVQWDGLESEDDGSIHDGETRNYYLDERMAILVRETVLRALPKYLDSIVKLHVVLPRYCIHDLSKALAHPAPNLHLLILDFFGDGDYRYDPLVDYLAVDLFNGHAPQLTKVLLANVGLRTEPAIPAFAAVRDLCVDGYTDAIIPALPLNFPAVRHLTIDSMHALDLAFDDSDSFSLSPFLSLQTLVVASQDVERGLPVMPNALLKGQPVRRVYLRLSSPDFADIGFAITSLLTPSQSPTHLSMFHLNRTELKTYPESLSRVDGNYSAAYMIELHRIANDTRLTLLLDSAHSEPAAGHLASLAPSLYITDMRFAFSQAQLICEQFEALPQLIALRVVLDEFGCDTYILNEDRPSVDCPRLEKITIYASGAYGLDRLQAILAVLHEFASAGPVLVLQGDPLPELVTSSVLLSRVCGITVERMHTFSKTAGCCAPSCHAPIDRVWSLSAIARTAHLFNF
ncbi:hypothetical protein EXIGLDRAFT_748225 [Exidia glandulosa HHB12029]|uniref:F-box domain-containing protein n=1 Tax=Exidia glandulosa HHB12029 TaxID=1314781 RepID=A0A165JSD4_EXIGL|nr:hypothetical protein EXIGLDRAFT_748225 [Exidia glandulosa HHB12029]